MLLCVCRTKGHSTTDLATLQKASTVFVEALEEHVPCTHAKTGASVHATTKVHSVAYNAEMCAAAGSMDNFSTQPCELAHKPLAKKNQRLTNNKKHQVGLSLLKANRRSALIRRVCQKWALCVHSRPWRDGQGRVLAADRYYSCVKDPSGCKGMNLRANMWNRAEAPEARWHLLEGGRGRSRMATMGYRIHDFAKNTAKNRRTGQVPSFLKKLPHLDTLPKKLAHFLNDYMPREFPSLALPPSNGQHKELTKDHVRSLLSRLRLMPTQAGDAEIALFNFLKLGSRGRRGCQHICCYPFKAYYGFHRQVWHIQPPGKWGGLLSCSPPIYIRIYTCSYEYVPIYTYTYIYTFTYSRAHIPPPVHVLMVVLAKVAAGPRILQTAAAVRVSSSR